ncbi:carboxylesterase/lipase family protein [Pseudonocardia xinjiangensis]|uniref:carboxylesterase/lipase family protein n=1 Tax=Pseudonocardia xinjiangensis TaxID=75289 RepID=UPI003D9211A0
MDHVVPTTSGQVRGRVLNGVSRFLGIPYAAAPVGPNRFAPPARPPTWDGVRDALEHGPTAPAARDPEPLERLLSPAVVIPGEEYLNVNIWTPEDAGSAPVMVWIHGGGYTNGSNSLPTFDGTAFARDGVVLVGMNYRLGAEGFLLLPGGTPNLGLLDQVAALRWVQENIAAFGGDPGNVTVFGESAGGMSIAALLAMPAAEGLFRRAVVQSGGGHLVLSAATAARFADHVADEAGVPLEDVHRVSPQRLVEAQQALAARIQAVPAAAGWGGAAVNALVYEPVVDGHVLPDLPIRRIAAGSAAGIDLLVGSTRDEYRLFLVPFGAMDRVTEAALQALAAEYGLPEDALDEYRALWPEASPGVLLTDVVTDWLFRIPTIRMAEAHPGAHVYEFDWASPVLDGALGACHALELGFVFDTLHCTTGLTGHEPPQELADAMHRAWVAFATTGDPGWEPYGQERNVRSFGTTVETVRDPRGSTRAVWDAIR